MTDNESTATATTATTTDAAAATTTTASATTTTAAATTATTTESTAPIPYKLTYDAGLQHINKDDYLLCAYANLAKKHDLPLDKAQAVFREFASYRNAENESLKNSITTQYQEGLALYKKKEQEAVAAKQAEMDAHIEKELGGERKRILELVTAKAKGAGINDDGIKNLTNTINSDLNSLLFIKHYMSEYKGNVAPESHSGVSVKPKQSASAHDLRAFTSGL